MNIKKIHKVAQQIADANSNSKPYNFEAMDQQFVDQQFEEAYSGEDFSEEIAQIVGHGANCAKYYSPFKGFVQFPDGTPRGLYRPWYSTF